MSSATKGDSGQVPVTSAEEVRHFAGPVTDHTVIEILAAVPTVLDVETAVLFARGQGDIAERAGHDLSGTAARVYDILARDELYIPNSD